MPNEFTFQYGYFIVGIKKNMQGAWDKIYIPVWLFYSEYKRGYNCALTYIYIPVWLFYSQKLGYTCAFIDVDLHSSMVIL